MTKSAVSRSLLAVCSLLIVLALATLFPHQSKMTSDLGYDTFCPFAPYSTITLLLLAGIGWAVRSHVKAQSIP